MLERPSCRERRAGSSPVDGEGRLIGILSDRDLRAITSRGALECTRAEEVMTRNVITLPPSATIQELVEAFTRWNLSALPIVDARATSV